MSASKSLTAYDDCFELFDRAMESERGAQYIIGNGFGAKESAYAFRARMNKARANDRDNNRRVHSDDPLHPLYGRSEYDRFTVKVVYDNERDVWLVQAKKNFVRSAQIEEIPEEDSELVEANESNE